MGAFSVVFVMCVSNYQICKKFFPHSKPAKKNLIYCRIANILVRGECTVSNYPASLLHTVLTLLGLLVSNDLLPDMETRRRIEEEEALLETITECDPRIIDRMCPGGGWHHAVPRAGLEFLVEALREGFLFDFPHLSVLGRLKKMGGGRSHSVKKEDCWFPAPLQRMKGDLTPAILSMSLYEDILSTHLFVLRENLNRAFSSWQSVCEVCEGEGRCLCRLPYAPNYDVDCRR